MAKQTKYSSNRVSKTKTTRSVINISLPPAMAKEVKAEVKQGGFASTSEFFRHILRERNTARFADELKKQRKEAREGKNMSGPFDDAHGLMKHLRAQK